VNSFSGSITCPNAASPTVCGGHDAYAVLANLVVRSGSTDISSRLIPAFEDTVTAYRMNLGAAFADNALRLTFIALSSSGVTLRYNGNASDYDSTPVTISSGVEQVLPLVTGYNYVTLSVQTTSGETRDYTLGIDVSDGSTGHENIVQTLTLSTAYSSVSGDLNTFRAAVKSELVSFLGVTNTSQIEMFTVTEGSTILKYVLFSGCECTTSGDPDATTMDATIQAAINDRSSTWYDTSKYNYLPYTTQIAATSAYVGCDNRCGYSDCDPIDGTCLTDSSDLPTYVWIIVGCVIGVLCASVGFCVLQWAMRKYCGKQAVEITESQIFQTSKMFSVDRNKAKHKYTTVTLEPGVHGDQGDKGRAFLDNFDDSDDDEDMRNRCRTDSQAELLSASAEAEDYELLADSKQI